MAVTEFRLVILLVVTSGLTSGEGAPPLTVGVLYQAPTNPDRQGGDPRADIFSQSRERRVTSLHMPACKK